MKAEDKTAAEDKSTGKPPFYGDAARFAPKKYCKAAVQEGRKTVGDAEDAAEYPYFWETISAYAKRYGLQMKRVYSAISSVCDEFKLTGCSVPSIKKWGSLTEAKAEAVATAIVRLTVPIDEEYSKRLMDTPTPDDEVPSVWLPDPEGRYREALGKLKHGAAFVGNGTLPPRETFEVDMQLFQKALPIDALAAVVRELALDYFVRWDCELQDDLVTGVFSILNAARLAGRDMSPDLAGAVSDLRSLMPAGGGDPASVVASADKRTGAAWERYGKWKRSVSNGSERFGDFIDSQK